MRDEVREEVSQNSEQRQTRDTVGCQNPRSAPFMLPDGGGGSRGLLRRRNDRGPIFHAKTSSGKIVAQVRYASRLPRFLAGQDYLGRILRRILAGRREKCDQNHSIYVQINCRIMKIVQPSSTLRSRSFWDFSPSWLWPTCALPKPLFSHAPRTDSCMG